MRFVQNISLWMWFVCWFNYVVEKIWVVVKVSISVVQNLLRIKICQVFDVGLLRFVVILGGGVVIGKLVMSVMIFGVIFDVFIVMVEFFG